MFTLKKFCSHIKAVLWAAIFLTLTCILLNIQAQQPKSVLSTKEIKGLAPNIAAFEKRLFNIKIESEMWLETKTNFFDPCEPWQRIPIYVSSTGWFEGRSGGKARVDVHKQVLEWVDGPAPYMEESYSIGFDGQYGRVVRHSIGHGGKTFLVKEGRILPEPPERLKAAWCRKFTGILFTLNFCLSGRGFTFSDLFGAVDDPNTKVPACSEFTCEEFEGVPCIKIASKGTKRIQESWWLDPSRGFALLGYKYTSILEDGTERLNEYIKVNKLKQVSDSIWWPMEAYLIWPPHYGSDNHWQRFVWHASNVIINDPKFDDRVFTVSIPDGYWVDDQVVGKKYRAGQQ